MKSNKNMLEVISHETKETINEMDVVTPTIYASVFSKFAALHNTDLSEEEKITDDLLNDKIAFLTDIQNQTSQNAQRLSDNTDKAISAIKNKNEKILTEVLKETQGLRAEIDSLREIMYKDELTHVYNRKWLHDHTLDESAEGLKSAGTLAIIYLNYFKMINDTYGHTVGDKVLVFIANELKKTREKIVRYGGDEFIVMFSDGTTQETALSKLNIIRENLLKKHLKVKDASFKVSFSFGTQEFKKGEDLNEIIEQADMKMYDDKIEIKKRVHGIS
jgi:diguanylate cyclase (GGDEF)-like protein